jgi:DNA-binding beta-propeller fold protein YncE
MWFKLSPSAIQTTYGTSTSQPQQITIDSSNNIYCVNSNSTIDKILATGGTVIISDLNLIGGSGYAIALDTYNNVYVTDYNNNVVFLVVQ